MIRAVLAIALITLLPSCRSVTGSVAPVQALSVSRPHLDAAARDGSRQILVESLSQVPMVVRTDAKLGHDDVTFHFHLSPEDPGGQPVYDPHTAGGWQFQLFLDLDEQSSTGYAGYEMLTRDSEDDLTPGTVVIRRTDGGTGPGGWGDEVGRLSVHVSPRLISLRVPVEMIQDDGVLHFGLDLYATVLGGPTGNQPVASFARAYEGISTWPGHGTALLASGTTESRGEDR